MKRQTEIAYVVDLEGWAVDGLERLRDDKWSAEANQQRRYQPGKHRWFSNALIGSP